MQTSKAHKAYIGLGTNLGNRAQNLDNALRALQEHDCRLLKCSSYIQTAPWGFESEHVFLNAVALMETHLTPEKLLDTTQQVERAMGRTHKSIGGNYSDRIIDLDIILYDDVVISSERMVIPHPLMARRDFVLKPLVELCPEMVHSVLGKTMRELLVELECGQ